MIRIPSLLRRLRRHQRGTAILEFALIAPVFILLLMGLFDYTWQMYAKQVLQGAVSNAARRRRSPDPRPDVTACAVAPARRCLLHPCRP